MKIAFVTTFISHYNKRTFELLSKKYQMQFYFFSKGEQWYWMKEHGVQTGDFKYEYVSGFNLGRTKITPSLPFKLLFNGYDVFIKCINGRFVLPLTFIISQAKRKPFVLWTGVWGRFITLEHRLYFPIVRYIYKKSDAIVVYGEHVKRYLVSEGVSTEKIFVAPHAVDNSKYNVPVADERKHKLREHLHIASSQKIILYIGRLEEFKGLSFLMEAFANISHVDALLVFAGTGSYKDTLERLAREKNITERVIFAGYIPTEETIAYYSIAYLYVLPSITAPNFKEPWGLVVNEAFNQGVPVVATDAVGAAAGGLVQNGINGYIVPEKNANALKQSIQRILDDENLHEQMSKNAKEGISLWTYERVVEQYENAIAYACKNFKKK